MILTTFVSLVLAALSLSGRVALALRQVWGWWLILAAAVLAVVGSLLSALAASLTLSGGVGRWFVVPLTSSATVIAASALGAVLWQRVQSRGLRVAPLALEPAVVRVLALGALCLAVVAGLVSLVAGGTWRQVLLLVPLVLVGTGLLALGHRWWGGWVLLLLADLTTAGVAVWQLTTRAQRLDTVTAAGAFGPDLLIGLAGTAVCVWAAVTWRKVERRRPPGPAYGTSAVTPVR